MHKWVCLGNAAGIAVVSLYCVLPAAAADDPVADFYRDKIVNIIVAGGPGGGYGLYANTISPFLSEHIPGKPTIVTRYMPGAGGIAAANYLYNVAPRDGTHLGALLSSQPISEKIGRSGVRYDSTKFAWIGRLSALNGVLTLRRDAPATTLDEIKKTEIVVGSSGVQYLPILSNWALGTKFKIISGYEGSQGGVLAYDRGEVHAYYSSWSALKSAYPQHLKDIQIIQSGLEKEPGFDDVPLLLDLVADAKKKEVVAFFAAEATIGRFLVAPPDTPPARVAALRKAFDDTMADSAFLAKAKTLDLDPRSGEFLQSVVSHQLSASPELIALAKQIVGIR